MELLLKIVNELNSSVFVLIAILVVALWGMFKLGMIINHYNHFSKKQDKFDHSLDTIKDSLSLIKAKVDIIYNKYTNTIKAHSPVSLTTQGEEISNAIRLDDLIIKYWEKISAQIKKNNPNNPYDIQIMSMNIANNIFENIFNDQEKVSIKKYAFETGRNLLEIYPIIGVLVRDKYLKEIGASLKEIDKHDPKSE
jgi:hypothetical protein